MRIEVEAKFRAETGDPLDELAARATIGRALLGPARTVDEVDRYLDTDDRRLEAAGWACRLRSRDGAVRISLKGPPSGSDGGWHHRRPEVEGPATDLIDMAAWPPSAAAELLAELSAGRPLAERLRLEQRRTERAVSLADGAVLGTMTLDRVRMSAKGATDPGELFIVELELDPAAPRAEDELPRLGAALAAVPGLVADPRTKLEHALERLDPN